MLSISLITLGDTGRLTGGYLYHRRMAELAPSYDASIDFVSFPDVLFPLPTSAAPLVLRRVRRSRPSVLVLDSISAAYLGPWAASLRNGSPLVAMLHQPPGGIDHGSLRSRIQARLDRLAYAHACRLLVASDALAEELVASGTPPARIRVVPPGRDSPLGSRVDVGDLRRGRNCALLCVANWVERKGILELLAAFARLPPDAATLHLAGDVAADRRYARRVGARLRRPDLASRVVVHGALPPERVSGLYQAADVFVLPSMREPYGTVYGEAMALGLPVVGWRAGNLPHLASDGREGLLATPGDIDGLTRAMERLANDERLRHELGRAAAGRAAERPTWHQSCGMFVGAIREVVE
jgi:glycosyltransferase involved in cell wall biosynthesis